MIDWNEFKYVMALHEGGTMKHAAELLKTDPTTISRHIKALSMRFGVVLFTLKRGGTWVVTPEGQQLLDVGRRMQASVESLSINAKENDLVQTVKLTSLEFLLTHYLAPKLQQFTFRHPDTTVQLEGSDKRLSLAYGEADMALRFGRPTEGQLIASKLGSIAFHIWSRPGMQKSEWVGLQESLDWTPEMQLGFAHFRKKPIARVSSFAAAARASISLNVPFIAPAAVANLSEKFAPVCGAETVDREIWSVIHETQRHSSRITDLRNWAKACLKENKISV